MRIEDLFSTMLIEVSSPTLRYTVTDRVAQGVWSTQGLGEHTNNITKLTKQNSYGFNIGSD